MAIEEKLCISNKECTESVRYGSYIFSVNLSHCVILKIIGYKSKYFISSSTVIYSDT